jgi:CubicO group peptidase (beta-lactamase class C family)
VKTLVHKQFLLSLVLICFFASLTARSPKAVKPQNTGLDEIDTYIMDQMHQSSIPGVSYAIIKNGKIMHMKGFGVANPEGQPMTHRTPLYIGSVGKTFTALAIRQLVNAGKLNLTTPVIHYLPSFTTADDEASRQITIHQLLDHTSGFSEQDGNDPVFYHTDATNEELVNLLSSFHLNRPAGVSFEYSNINYIILGRVIEVVSGLSYPEYVQQFIFDPLEMENSFTDEAQAKQDGLSMGYRYYFGLPVAVDLNEPQGAIAAGFLMSSAEDMAHYLIAFTEYGCYNGISIVDQAGQPCPQDSRLTYNIDWLNQKEAVRPTNTETHSGAWLNYSAGIAFMPERKVGVVVLANSFPAQWLPAKDAFALTYDVLCLYTGSTPNPPTISLALEYILVDAILLVLAGFIAFRFISLYKWRQQLSLARGDMRTLLPALLIDLSLPMFILLVAPGMILSSTGHFNPFWSWNRLAIQVPDATMAILALSCCLLLVGITKVLIWVRLRHNQTRRTVGHLY